MCLFTTRPVILPTLLIFTGILLGLPGRASAEEKWIALFNGKDLDGWTPKIRGCGIL